MNESDRPLIVRHCDRCGGVIQARDPNLVCDCHTWPAPAGETEWGWTKTGYRIRKAVREWSDSATTDYP